MIYSKDTGLAISSILNFINEVRVSLKEREIKVNSIKDLYLNPEDDQFYSIGYTLPLHDGNLYLWYGSWIRVYEKTGLPIHLGINTNDPKTRQEYSDKFEFLCKKNFKMLEKAHKLEGYQVAAVMPKFINNFNNYKGRADLFYDFTLRL